jgi:hypothetical protein
VVWGGVFCKTKDISATGFMIEGFPPIKLADREEFHGLEKNRSNGLSCLNSSSGKSDKKAQRAQRKKQKD